MAVNLDPPGELLPVPGVRVGTSCAGIKQQEFPDLTVIELAEGSTTAAVFTQSAFRAPPVDLASERLTSSSPRALVINSGNANASTGQFGRDDAVAVCAETARNLNLAAESVLPFSTGVIGERLPVDKIVAALSSAAASAQEDGWASAARAIMTTDTVPKAISRTLEIDGCEITITGIAKGSGMICPNMATMLAYICCDAAIDAQPLDQLTRDAANASFNRITVDGDTSTNDSFVVAATGLAGHARITSTNSPSYQLLAQAITEVAIDLAQRIVRDGEGATKFVTVRVEGGASASDCLDVAYTVAHSPLVKTALFAGDANWGRFCMAIGRAGVAGLAQERVALWLDDVQVAQDGLVHSAYTEEDGARVLAQDELVVRIDLGMGDCAEKIWTTDLSYEYVRINAEYRT
ncbi:MAG: bifunctional glutamate N-acetyltransferase/amino-acid acetyltransferase ArgJ [Pseudomonadaceae bacterium]|nr:bifunctional glutamate N-acetyltransferase/amino-acid acetyltransferase ArgJ [Pseudomonadaceae bacterium]